MENIKGTEIEVVGMSTLPVMRAVTRKQVKALRAAGHDLIENGKESDKKAIAALVDWVLDNIYPDLGDDVDYNKAFWLAMNTYKSIYEATEPETKN